MVERIRLASSKRFVEFIHEREKIRQLKSELNLPPPWTDDPILQTYRFTNVRRRHDRVSLWLQENVYADPLFSQHEPSLSAFQFMSLCRWVNWPPTLKAIMEAGLWPQEHLNLRAIGKIIDKRCGGGDKAWTGAYMICAKSSQIQKGIGKGRFVAEQVVGSPLHRAWPELQFMLQTRMRRPVWRVLVDCSNWGSFMSGQVVDDLTWTSWLNSPNDEFSWAPMGPGSLRGMNRYFSQPLNSSYDEMSWCKNLTVLRQYVLSELGKDFSDLTLMDIQNCLCEFDKYERVRTGMGRPRAKYKPEGAY